MTNLYDTLGVGKDATPDAIKRAYRKKASKAHPDRNGGDASKMAAINRAWQTLGDPVLRLTYDQTGTDAAQESLDKQAQSALMTLFEELLPGNEYNMLGAARARIVTQLGQNGAQRAQAVEARRRLMIKRERVRRKDDGPNAYLLIVDKHIGVLDASLVTLDGQRQVINRMTEMLTVYEEDKAPGAARPFGEEFDERGRRIGAEPAIEWAKNSTF